MKVLFLTPSVRLLGARQSLLALVTHLPPEIEPLVVCPGNKGLTQELRTAGVAVEVVPHGAWRKAGGRIRASVFEIPALRRLVRGFSPTIVHCNEFHCTPQGVRAAAGAGGNVGVTSHVRLGITPRQIRNYDLGRCDRIAAVSEACRELFADSGLLDRVEVVYNGVDVSAFRGLEGSTTRRGEWGWSADDLVVGLFGLVSPRKNQLVAAEAVAEANRRGVRARLLIAGDAFRGTEEYGERLRARINADDLRDNVRWLPFQRDVAPLYAACDVNLLISAEEGFGRTIIEAGAMGIPSIGSRIGGIPELIRDGETGWLVQEGSVAALADAIVRLGQSRDALRRIGDATRAHVLARFSIEAHVDAMRAFWNRALEHAAREAD